MFRFCSQIKVSYADKTAVGGGCAKVRLVDETISIANEVQSD
jgi:hypothetical protein